MRKGVLLVVVFSVLILSMGFASAGLIDWVKGLFGDESQASPQLRPYDGNSRSPSGGPRDDNETNQTHNICSEDDCVEIQGAGTDECQHDYQCAGNETNQTHNICLGGLVGNCVEI